LPVCPHVECEHHRYYKGLFNGYQSDSKDAPFQKQSDVTKHLKEVHNESPFPCDIPGCDRTGGKGYARQKDLKNHRAKQHPEFTQALVTEHPDASDM
jgi:hypothetical protein